VVPESIPSSVTKFAAEVSDCIDRNGNGAIDTSTGANDVRDWGEDECMLWNTELPDPTDYGGFRAHGARATAWDGKEDSETGRGGHVWVGTCPLPCGDPVRVYGLDGDTGVVEYQIPLPDVCCAYGGAVDGDNGFWFMDVSNGTITRVDTVSLSWQTRPTSCGYGIAVDSRKRVWTGGPSFLGSSGPFGVESCVARYDPGTGIEDTVDIPDDSGEGRPYLRGIAVGSGISSGFVWAAETAGRLYQIDEDTMEIVGTHKVGRQPEMIGVAVDYHGYVWTVSQQANQAFKTDPITFDFLSVTIGLYPYTYSDMTGMQLRNVVTVR
jgi:streptogramin lyase